MSVETLPDRPDIYVVARILERLWREGSPMLKTRLQVASDMNYDVFRKYLAWMHGRGLVMLMESEDGHERVALTRRGSETHAKIVGVLDDLIHQRRF